LSFQLIVLNGQYIDMCELVFNHCFTESIADMFKRDNKAKYNTEEEEFDNTPAPTIAGAPKSKEAQKKKKKPYMFPYWCNYIAWICE